MNNVYNSISVNPNTPTIINSLIVPTRSGYSLKGFLVWSEVDCEITVSINVQTISGGRISGSVQTLFLDWSASPYGLNANDVVSVIATQNGTIPWDVKSTILVEQL